MRRLDRWALVLTIACLVPGSAGALSRTFDLFMTGDQEAPGPGDPDGLATGTLTLDDVTGEISWSFTYTDIAVPNAMHIHGPNAPAGTPAPVFIGLTPATTGGAGTLINSQIESNLANITQVLSSPDTFYVNIHNVDFSGGAVRGQVPEPSAGLLLGAGLAALAVRRRRPHGPNPPHCPERPRRG